MSLKERIDKANCRRGPVNCFGTALYLGGFESQDSFLQTYKIEEILENSEVFSEPKKYFLAIFRNSEGDIKHAALVTNVRPLRFVHRRGQISSLVDEDVPLDEITGVYGDHVEYVPSKISE